MQVSDTEVEKLKLLFDEKAGSGLKIMKFVPASGAASRMFKSLFAALEELNSGKGEEEVLAGNKDAREFYERIDDFAFAGELKDIIRKEGKNRGFRNFLEYLLNAGE